MTFKKHVVHTNRATGIPNTLVYAWLRQNAVEVGSDPAAYPDPPFRMMRPDEAAQVCGISTATLYRMVERGSFPRPVPLIRRAIQREAVEAEA